MVDWVISIILGLVVVMIFFGIREAKKIKEPNDDEKDIWKW